jgi:hypothetical protein
MPTPDLSDTSPLAQLGFHRLKDVLDTKSHMGPSASFVATHIDSILAATLAESPARTQPARFARLSDPDIKDDQRERFWELAAYMHWSKTPCLMPGVWSRLLAYQLPLFDNLGKDGWGYIDLFGVMASHEPCVVELKKEPGRNSKGGTNETETPLRMILEAAGYAVALRKNWNHFSSEWVSSLELSSDATTVPDNFHLIAAAPAGFWLEWSPMTARGRNKLPSGVWDALRGLCNSLKNHGYPVHFVSLSGSPEKPSTLAVQPLELF